MALSLDDRLLGEKVNNYCSSSEDEANESDEEVEEEDEEEPPTNSTAGESAPAMQQLRSGPQTGPKGVLADYKQFKALERLHDLQRQMGLVELAKKSTHQTLCHKDEVAIRSREEAFDEALETLEEDDEFLVQYRQNRIRELRNAVDRMSVYGRVYNLDVNNFVEEVDSTDPTVTVIVHVYEPDNRGCIKVDECLQELSTTYPQVKFCRVRASDANLSRQFSRSGVPAFVIYKNRDVIGNLLCITRDLDNDFYTVDVENYLIERGFLPDKTIGLLLNTRLNMTSSNGNV